KKGGGTPQHSYCQAGNGGNGNEPCQEIVLDQQTGFSTTGAYSPPNGIGGIDRPAEVPYTSDANFMIVNGSFDPNSGLPPGKVWCQTIERGNTDIGYYVFTVWVQNMISGGRNLDIPQLRLTVCDMVDPDTDEPDLSLRTGTLNRTNPVRLNSGPSKDLIQGTLLPGVTLATNNLGDQVVHAPEPPNNRLKPPRVLPSYGAAMPCNLPGEARDARLKILGSSFIITEEPDNWRVVRCIYRAPKGVSEMNICVENLSITKNGNDFGIDGISFRECENADAPTFDKLLKGDGCELANGPQNLSIPLSTSFLDFSGRLIGDQVALNWLVINENNSVRYEIQRSVNGTDFYAIGNVDAKSQASALNEYQFSDREIPENARYLYYRLNVHYDGGYTKFGPIVEIDVRGMETFEMTLIPNPSPQGDEVKLRFDVPQGKARLTVTSLMGTPVYRKIFETVPETMRFICPPEASLQEFMW
ncbi:MAG: hypothetical protein HC880_08150, partial [Bacteroidia bacterium]|nr:hypothetical protein [Bacteroidia bacterium]